MTIRKFKMTSIDHILFSSDSAAADAWFLMLFSIREWTLYHSRSIVLHVKVLSPHNFSTFWHQWPLPTNDHFFPQGQLNIHGLWVGQNMPLWHKNYFEPKTCENRLFFWTPVSIYKQSLPKELNCHKFSPGEFLITREDLLISGEETFASILNGHCHKTITSPIYSPKGPSIFPKSYCFHINAPFPSPFPF